MKNKTIKGILILSIVTLTGCSTNEKEIKEVSNPKQFEAISNVENVGEGNSVFIIQHKETNKKFIILDGYNGSGIAPLD